MIHTDCSEPPSPVPLDTPAEPGFDVEPWGDNALIAYSSNGEIYVGIYWSNQTTPFRKMNTERPSGAWNGASTFGRRPNITVLNGEVVVAWEEQVSLMGWRMAARAVR